MALSCQALLWLSWLKWCLRQTQLTTLGVAFGSPGWKLVACFGLHRSAMWPLRSPYIADRRSGETLLVQWRVWPNCGHKFEFGGLWLGARKLVASLASNRQQEMSKWEVVGGADKGGILVRKGQDLKSEQLADRLSTGALVFPLCLHVQWLGIASCFDGCRVCILGTHARLCATSSMEAIAEAKSELNHNNKDRKKEALKKVIQAMTLGNDVSSLFPDVVKCMQTNSLDLKKLVYLYVINYAKAQPDLAILAINAFRTD
eukprot:s3440_g5.t1